MCIRDSIRDEDAAGNHRSERQVERGTGLLGLPLVILLESGDGRETNRGDGAGDGAGPGIPGRRRYLAARSELEIRDQRGAASGRRQLWGAPDGEAVEGGAASEEAGGGSGDGGHRSRRYSGAVL